MSKQLLVHFQIQIEPNSTTYICISCLHDINRNKTPLYQVSNKICKNQIIPLIETLTQL
jgi:hypothetical protein